MPQPKKPAKKPAAAKRKPAAKKPPEPEIQVNRMTDTTTPPTEETQEERDAAGAARQAKLRGKQPVPDYEPGRQTLENADLDQVAAEENRQAELQHERDVHNHRTGDASLSKGTWT